MESLGTGARGGHGAALTWETGGAPAPEKEGNPEMEKEKEAAQIEMTAKRGKKMDSLGMVVKGFKLGCNRAYSFIFAMNSSMLYLPVLGTWSCMLIVSIVFAI